MLYAYLIIALIYIIPVAVPVGFIVSLCRYIAAKRKNKRLPGSFTDEQIRSRGIILIVFAILTALVVGAVIQVISLFNQPVAFM